LCLWIIILNFLMVLKITFFGMVNNMYCPCDRYSIIGTKFSTDCMYLFTINFWYKESGNLVYYHNGAPGQHVLGSDHIITVLREGPCSQGASWVVCGSFRSTAIRFFKFVWYFWQQVLDKFFLRNGSN
jgi:hypothetical protein